MGTQNARVSTPQKRNDSLSPGLSESATNVCHVYFFFGRGTGNISYYFQGTFLYDWGLRDIVDSYCLVVVWFRGLLYVSGAAE